MEKIGALCGKFLPPHLGHVYAINESAKQCDFLYVILAENPERCEKLCQKAGFPNIKAKQRLSWLKEHFKDNPKIKFLYFDETGLEAFPKGLKEWSEKLKKILPKNVNMKFADETYRELNEKYFPEFTFVPFDRNVIPISATMIRNDLKKYFNFLLPQSKVYFEKILTKKGTKEHE
ncbi:MAG: adenylyltransferase/cytidyltransferase family protein [Clostridia bacterium]